MENRRNYYRILQVQPDAPQALIETCYRTLMQKLKYHPDLGGDHWNAALVNEAYRVLSDPRRRKEYDESLGDRLFDFHRHPERSRGAQSAEKPGEDRPLHPVRGRTCPFCETQNSFVDNGNDLFCDECHSPLQLVGPCHAEQEFRRAIQRIHLHEELQYYVRWPQTPRMGRLCNISPTGLAMTVNEPLRDSQIIKIDGMALSGIGRIVHIQVEPQSGSHNVGVILLTASFNIKRGSFLDLEV